MSTLQTKSPVGYVLDEHSIRATWPLWMKCLHLMLSPTPPPWGHQAAAKG